VRGSWSARGREETAQRLNGQAVRRPPPARAAAAAATAPLLLSGTRRESPTALPALGASGVLRRGAGDGRLQTAGRGSPRRRWRRPAAKTGQEDARGRAAAAAPRTAPAQLPPALQRAPRGRPQHARCRAPGGPRAALRARTRAQGRETTGARVPAPLTAPFLPAFASCCWPANQDSVEQPSSGAEQTPPKLMSEAISIAIIAGGRCLGGAAGICQASGLGGSGVGGRRGGGGVFFALGRRAGRGGSGEWGGGWANVKVRGV
jgi:hypothetical protein